MIYRWGGVLNRDVGAMSLWEFRCVVDGYIAANSRDDDKSLSAKEQDDLAEWLGI